MPLRLSAIHGPLSSSHALHPDNMPAGIEWIIMVEARKNTVCDLFHHQSLICLSLFANPEYPLGMPLHIFNVSLRMKVLLLSKGNSKASLNFLSFHIVNITIVMPFWHFYFTKYLWCRAILLPAIGQDCSCLGQISVLSTPRYD